MAAKIKSAFIEQLPNGRWRYGLVWNKPWWKFWAENRETYFTEWTKELAETGLQELINLYSVLGVIINDGSELKRCAKRSNASISSQR